MRGKVARFLRKVVSLQEGDFNKAGYRRLKKTFYRSSVKEKHIAYSLMVKPDLVKNNENE